MNHRQYQALYDSLALENNFLISEIFLSFRQQALHLRRHFPGRDLLDLRRNFSQILEHAFFGHLTVDQCIFDAHFSLPRFVKWVLLADQAHDAQPQGGRGFGAVRNRLHTSEIINTETDFEK